MIITFQKTKYGGSLDFGFDGKVDSRAYSRMLGNTPGKGTLFMAHLPMKWNNRAKCWHYKTPRKRKP